GQYKLARAGAIPGLGMKRRVAAKAFMMAMASTAYIWSIMNDPEKKKLYDALPEWDRLGSYHFWGAKGEDGQRAHWRIPRTFEAGFLFGTIP
ncbi:hypothetical protein U2054_15530, partial [Listeria monocytogenes]|uniref:hypothetical protein n=1 Tax=Listeria monocytogenes TaxID=1639 RepID=UPI002FDBC169